MTKYRKGTVVRYNNHLYVVLRQSKRTGTLTIVIATSPGSVDMVHVMPYEVTIERP